MMENQLKLAKEQGAKDKEKGKQSEKVLKETAELEKEIRAVKNFPRVKNAQGLAAREAADRKDVSGGLGGLITSTIATPTPLAFQ